MTTKKIFSTLILAAVATATLSATGTAQVLRKQVIRPSKNAIRRIQRQRLEPKNPNQVSFAEALKLMAPYKQWMIGANTSGYLYQKKSWNGPANKSYNLKGLVPRKFLQYEKQGAFRGINIGWTDNASASTAAKRAKWFFTRPSASNKPLVYGEPLALAWGNSKNSYVKNSKRTVGINLNWSSKPVYEWVILGGKPGTRIRKGKDRVIIYNLKAKHPLMYFRRTVGGHIGWPDSKTWKKQAWDKVKKHVTIENAVKALVLIGSQL